jgi:hypothetical protein
MRVGKKLYLYHPHQIKYPLNIRYPYQNYHPYLRLLHRTRIVISLTAAARHFQNCPKKKGKIGRRARQTGNPKSPWQPVRRRRPQRLRPDP